MPPGKGPAVAQRILAHYAGCASLLEASFTGAPIVFANFPRGFHAPPRFRVTQIPLSSSRIGWLVQREYAVEFHGWAPMPEEPERLRFGRILLDPPRGEHSFKAVRDAALRLREQLQAAALDAIPTVDGLGGITLWLPFAQAPPAAKIRVRLQRLCARAAALEPDRLCIGPLPSGTKVRLDASSNAPGRYSVLPYSLRGTPALPVCVPVTWEELRRQRAAVVCTAEAWPARFDKYGDLFAQGGVRLGAANAISRSSSAMEGPLKCSV